MHAAMIVSCHLACMHVCDCLQTQDTKHSCPTAADVFPLKRQAQKCLSNKSQTRRPHWQPLSVVDDFPPSPRAGPLQDDSGGDFFLGAGFLGLGWYSPPGRAEFTVVGKPQSTDPSTQRPRGVSLPSPLYQHRVWETPVHGVPFALPAFLSSFSHLSFFHQIFDFCASFFSSRSFSFSPISKME